MDDGGKLTVRPVKQRRGINLLMLCDEQGRPLPNQSDLQWAGRDSSGCPTVTVTFAIDGRIVSLQGEVEAAMRSLGSISIPLQDEPAAKAAPDRDGPWYADHTPHIAAAFKDAMEPSALRVPPVSSFIDEVDRMVGDEGDPIELVRMRCLTRLTEGDER